MRLLVLLSFLFFCRDVFGQPSNDDCNGATAVNTNGSCYNGTTVDAVDNWQQVVGCQNGNNNSSHPDVWYTFTSTGSQGQIDVTTSGSWAGDVEIVLVQGNCTTGFSIVGSQCGASPLSASFNGLQNGTTYYYTISNANNGTAGTFQTCVTTTTPPTLAGQDCSNAAILCTSTQFSQSTSNAGFGNQEVTTTNSCWIVGGERQSKWFKFTAGCSGTLEFNINPINAGDDYDWALWNITSDPNNCTTKGNSIACNWSGCNDATGLSSCISSEPGAQNSNGPPCFGAYGAWGAPITVTAGNTYALLVDNFTTSNSGFVLTFGGACNGGTAKIGPNANFSYAASSCGTYNFTKTCATSNSSFLWQFGDGSTATTQNASHTYATTGSYIVTLEVTDALGCIETTSQTINISAATAPAATSPQSFCSSSNPTVASLAATGTALQWYSAATGGSPLASTTALTSQTYYVSQTVGGCESARTPVTVTVSAATAPAATSPQSFCSSTNPTVASLAATGTALQWYGAATGGSPLAPTTALTTQTYYVSQTVGGCESARTPVTVTVSVATAPAATSPQSFCSSSNPTVASLAATGTALQWYSAATGGSPLASTTALTSQTYYVSQTVGGCESARTPVTVTVSAATAPAATSPQSFCSSTNPTVASLAATGTALQWYGAATGGSPLAPTTALTTQTYYVSQTVGGCESARTPVTVTVSVATAPAATSPQSFCSSSNPTVASLAATGTALQWYSAATGGSPLASTTALTSQTYYVSQTVGGCESARTPVTVTVSAATAPAATSPQSFCSSTNPTVASLAATGTALQWYGAATGGSPLAPTTALTTQTYYVSQTVGGCESARTPVTVTVSVATAPAATSPQTFCSSSNPTVASLAATGTALQWYSAATGGSPLASTTALATQTYYVSQTVGGCESARTPVSVTVSAATAPVATSPQSFCSSTNPTVASLSATGTALQWYGAATGGSPLAPTTALTTQTYYVSQMVGGCESARTPVTVTVSAATAPTATSPQSFCSSTNPTVASLAATGTALQWYSAATGGSPLASTTALTTQTYYVSQTVGGCESTRTPVTVNVSVVNVSVTIAASSTSICAGQSVTFTATPVNGGTTPVYQWKVNGINAGTNSATFTSSSLADADQVSVVMTSNALCATTPTAASNTITMTASSVSPQVTIAASSTSICAGQSVTFTATPVNGGTTPVYQWKVNGVNAGTNSVTFTSSLADADQVSVVMTSNALCATTPTASSNTITMTASSVSPQVTIAASSTSICAGQSVTFTATPVNGGTTPAYQWKVNGVNAGTNSVTFTSSSLADADQVSVVMTSNALCATTPTASSNTITMTASSVSPQVTIAASSTSICAGQSVTFTATPVNGGTTPAYQWKVNGINAGTNSATFTSSSLADADQVSVVMTSNALCATTPTAASNTITMTASSVSPQVTIAASSTSICAGQSVTFTATPVNGGTTPVYQWKVNGVNAGTNSVTFTSSLADADQVSVVMTSNALCATTPTASSNTITMTASSVSPQVTIAASSTSICAGQSVTFTATPVNGGTTPAYQWKVNGVNAGTNSVTFTSSSLADADQVSVVMTSNALCATTPTASSNTITMTASSVSPQVTIAASSTSICAGQSVTFTATPVNGGTSPAYQWRLNGTNVGSNSPTFTSTTLANGDQVSVVMTSNALCATTPTAASNTITMTASSVSPQVTIAASSTSICAGQSVTFTATPVNGGTTPAYQWKVNGINAGTNSATFTSSSLADADQVSVVMTSNALCATTPTAASNTITMTASSVSPQVTIAASSTSICAGQSVTFTATPVNGGTTPAYQWKMNGINAGTNSVTFTSSSLADADQVSVVMTSNALCATTPTAASNIITMTASSVSPQVTIAASSTSICAGQSVTFTATPVNGGTTPAYQWKVNGINAGTNSVTFTSSSLADADQVSVVMTSNALCATTPTAASNTITMTASSVTASASSPDIPCGQTTGTISIAAIGDASPFFYSIDGINFQSNNVFNGVAPGSYNIKVKDNRGCNTDVATTIKSQNTPILIITDPPSSCLPIDITTAGITTGSDAGLTYSYWTNASATNVLSNPAAVNLSGTYYIKGATTSGCFDIKPVTVTINAAPLVQIINPSIACEPATVDLTLSSITNGSEAGLSYTYWNDSSATVSLANPGTISNSGIYFISGKTAAGCSTTKPVVVTISNKIEGIRYPAVTAILNVPLTLHARTIAANYSYEWSPPEGLNFSSIQDPTYKYDKTMQYFIKMTSEQGCITTDTMLVTIKPLTGVAPTMFVPKAWSPNGDGHNDYLFPLAVNVKELKYFRIFNRWGNLVFESRELLKGWDGQLNGKQQPMEVYTWILEAIGINGEKIRLMGNSVLLR